MVLGGYVRKHQKRSERQTKKRLPHRFLRPLRLQKDPNQKGHLVIDEKAAGIVREIFTLYAQGYGKTAIARMLNDRDVPNPTEYKRIQGLRYKQPENKTCTLWKYATISGMLRNEIYIGNMVQGKYGSVSYKTKQNRPKPPNEWYRVENTHEPIIDCALWTRVQQLLEQRSKPFATGKIGLFAGKTRCAGCSCTMRSSKSHDRHYLKCPTRPCAPSACTGSFLSADALELAVTAELNRLSATYLDLDELEQRLTFKDDLKEQIKQLQTETALYQKKLDTYTTSLRELYLDKVKGLLTEDDYLLFSRDFTAEKLRLNRQITDCQKRMQELEKSMPSDNSPRQRIKHYTRPDHLNREIVEKLIDYITVGKRLPGTQEVPVEIHWNF